MISKIFMPLVEINKLIAATIATRMDEFEHKLDMHAQNSLNAAANSAQFREEVRSEIKELRTDMRALVILVGNLQQSVADRNGVQKAVNWMVGLIVAVGGIIASLFTHFWSKN